MGKAIAAASILVFLSFAFVFVQLWARRPAGAAPAGRPSPVLDSRDDGSVYALTLDLQRFERRLVEEEKRWVRLQADLDAARKERDEVKASLDSLQAEVRRLRRQLQERPAPPDPDPGEAGNTPANTPSVVPGDPLPPG
jgi:septal ring factor EnvC (AmiA/AmiB activator)